MWSSTTRTKATTTDRRIVSEESIIALTICWCLGRCNTTWIFPDAGTLSIATTRLAGKLIVECLQYWVREAHVDGFRFDEGSILSRGEDGMPAVHPPLVWLIELDEDLADTKLIAEAWDAAGLYQIGHFPGDRWAEWNGRYRDDVRRFVRGDPGLVGAIASRLAGSADIYHERGGSPMNSINFVTCHDGFTLNDLVSFNQKHNEANGENNADGTDNNLSWNCGAEGDSDNPDIESLRDRQIRNFAAILLLSRGVPMFAAGDEIRRSQKGNNNCILPGQRDQLVRLEFCEQARRPASLLQIHDSFPQDACCSPTRSVSLTAR